MKIACNYWKKKIEFLGLENIKLIKGDFSKTMSGRFDGSLCCVLFDCDLYSSYALFRVCMAKFVFWGNALFRRILFLEIYPARKAVDEFFSDKRKPFVNPLLEGDFERWGLIKI